MPTAPQLQLSRMCQSDPKCTFPKMGLRMVKVLGIQTFNLALLSDYTISSVVRWSHHQQRTLSQSNWMDILMYSLMEDVCIYWQDLKVFCQFAVEVFTLIHTRSTDQDDICFGIASAAFCHWSHLECIRTAILDAQGSTIAIKSNVPKWSKVHFSQDGTENG